MSRRGTALTAMTAAVALLFPATFLAHEADPSRYNYREDVRPIFVEHCGGCHRQGGAGPMSLLEYREAVPWANAVKMQVLEGRMPPWLPEEGVGRFRHQRTLSAEEIDIIVDWAVGQTPEGETLVGSEGETAAGNDGAPPDLMLEPSNDVVFDEDEYEKTACVVLPTGLDASRLVEAFGLMPGLPTVTRRATIRLGEGCELERPPLATWLPGQGSVTLPEGTGLALGEGATISVELRYVKGWNDDGKRLVDRPRLGIWFAESARPLRMRRLAGATETLGEAVTLVAIYPEPADTSEEPLYVEARRPDGAVVPLLSIEAYDPSWREKYVLETPLELPVGTEIHVSRPAVWIDFTSTSTGTASGESLSPLLLSVCLPRPQHRSTCSSTTGREPPRA